MNRRERKEQIEREERARRMTAIDGIPRGSNGMPILPAIAGVLLVRGERPYEGPIEVGMVFAWEPDLPHARELLVVTRIGGPLAPLVANHGAGSAVIFRGDDDERKIWSTFFGEDPMPWRRGQDREVWNDESRFREAVVPTIYKPMAHGGVIRGGTFDAVGWPFKSI